MSVYAANDDDDEDEDVFDEELRNVAADTHLQTYEFDVAYGIIYAAIDQLYIVRNAYETPLCTQPPQTQTAATNTLHLETRLPCHKRFHPDTYKGDGLYYRLTGEPYNDALDRLLFDQLRSTKMYAAHALVHIGRLVQQRSDSWFDEFEHILQSNWAYRNDEHEFIVEFVRNQLSVKRLKERLTTAHETQKRLKEQPKNVDVSI